MDPTDLRAGLAERLGGTEPIDAQTFNSVCFMLSRALEDLALSVPEAAPLARRLLRVAARVVIDTGLPGSSPETWKSTEETALLWIDEALRSLGYQAKPQPEGGRAELARPEEDWGRTSS
jgi:O-succinylbenzoate synthase